MRLYIVVFLCCLFQFFMLSAQNIKVLEKGTKKPIENATIYSEKPRLFAVTNAKGKADISAFVQAEKIEIRSLGHKTILLSYAEIAKLQFEVELKASTITLDELVVSATRDKQSSRHVSGRIAQISAKDIVLSNPQTAADMLGTTGEVFIQKSQQGGGSPMIRGFSANRLLYSVDGVRMNNAIFRSGNVQQVISLDAFAISHTEVLFGPGSVMYGSDAIGGVMRFQTLSPVFSSDETTHFSGHAVSRFASANKELSNHIDFTIGRKKWAFLSSITYSEFDDLRMGKYGPEEYTKPVFVETIDGTDYVRTNTDSRIQKPSAYAQTNLMQKIAFLPSKNWDIGYALHYSQTSDYARYDRLIEYKANGDPVHALWKYGPQIWAMNHLSVSHTNKTLFYDKLSYSAAWQVFEESRIDRKLHAFRERTQLEKVNAYSQNVDLLKSVKKHTFYYGGEFVLNEVRSTAIHTDIRTQQKTEGPSRYPQSEWMSSAAYLSYRFQASTKMEYHAGIRYNMFSMLTDFTRNEVFYPQLAGQTKLRSDATTGSLGCIYSPDSTWKIYIGLSSGFRAPNVDDIGKLFDFGPGEVIVPNKDLKAEQAYNAEFGLAKIWLDRVKFDGAIYATQLENAMVRRVYQVNGQDSIMINNQLSRVYALQNAAQANVFGGNIGIELKLPAGFSISTRYNIQEGIEEMPDGEISRARHAAPAFGQTKLTFKHKKLTIQFYAIYSDGVRHEQLNEEEKQRPAIYAKNADGKPYSPAWQTFNLKAMYEVKSFISLQAGVENISDLRYRPYSSGLVAPGRNFMVSIKAGF